MTAKAEETTAEFAESLAEAESMFFRAVDVSNVESVDECCQSMQNFFAEKFVTHKNADVLLALCGFLATFADFIAEESGAPSRTVLMMLQVGMQRAHMATECELEMADPVSDKEHDPRFH
jgi:hypothetical protein